jgi:hypothetical protein
VKIGTLPAVRLANFYRLAREMEFEQEKVETGLVSSVRKRWRGIAKSAKEIIKGGAGNRGHFLRWRADPASVHGGGTRARVRGRSAF